MNPSAPIGKVIELAKKHPVITVSALGIVAVLAVIRARSGSSSGFDETGTGASSGGGGGGGSVPAETVPGSPSSLPATPTQPSTVLSSPIVSVPLVPSIPGYGNDAILQPAYSPLDFCTVNNASPIYVAPMQTNTPTPHPVLNDVSKKSSAGLGMSVLYSGLGAAASKPAITPGLGAAASSKPHVVTSGLGAAVSTSVAKKPTISAVAGAKKA